MPFRDEFGDWTSEEVEADTYNGTGAWGDEFSPTAQVECWYQYGTRTMTSTDGTTILSEAQIFCDIEYRTVLTVGSRVRIPGDARQYKVLRAVSWPGDDAHLEVWLV